jgi:hypothetical protein
MDTVKAASRDNARHEPAVRSAMNPRGGYPIRRIRETAEAKVKIERNNKSDGGGEKGVWGIWYFPLTLVRKTDG